MAAYVAPRVTPFKELPDGSLVSPWGKRFISVQESRSRFEQWLTDYVINEALPLPELVAIRKVLQSAKFDPICGHWIATEREKRGYFYVSMKYDGKQREVGVHALAQIVMGASFPLEQRRNGSTARAPVDHRCRYHPCFNPWHTQVTSTAENTRNGVTDRREIALLEGGHFPLIGRHELAP